MTPAPLTKSVKNTIEAMVISQVMTQLKFTNKKGETLWHQDWIVGVDCETMNDFGDVGDMEDRELDVFIETPDEPRVRQNESSTEAQEGAQHEEADDDTAHVIDEMIDELNNEVIPSGEEVLNDLDKDSAEDSAG